MIPFILEAFPNFHWFLQGLPFVGLNLDTSYAKAAGSGASAQPRTLYNEEMVICMSQGITYEQLAEELHKKGMWNSISGFQRVDFGRRFVLVVELTKHRDFLVENGLNISGIHVAFTYHKRREMTRVYLSQIPSGITPAEIKEALSYYGGILQVNPVYKILYGHRFDTGDRVLTFKTIARHIPSEVYIRGWRAFIKNNGHPSTCRVCDLTGHCAKDCPATKKEQPKSEDNPAEATAKGDQPENTHKDKPAGKSPEVTPMEVQLLKTHITQEEIMDTVILYRKRSFILRSQIQRS